MVRRTKKAKSLPLKNLFIVLTLIVGVIIGYVISHFSAFSVESIEPSINQAAPEGIACIVPKGSYQAGISGNGTLNWKVVCGGKIIKSGQQKLDESLPLGQRNLPTALKKGSRFQDSTTLSALCNPIKAEGYNQVCDVCKLVDCTQIKLSANVTVTETSCQNPQGVVYTASGNGAMAVSGKFSYNRSDCSASGTARGQFKLTLQGGDVIIF